MATTTDYLKLHLIVWIWSFTAIIGVLVSIPALEMVFYRTLLASIGMGALILLTKGSFAVSPADRIKMLFTGMVVAFHWLAFFGAARVGNASVSLVGFATASLWTALLDPLVHGKKIKIYEITLGLLVISGLVIIFSFDFQYKMGLFLGMLAGLTSAIFSVINSSLVRKASPYTITFYEMTGAFLTLSLFLPLYALFTGQALQLSPTGMDWFYIAVLAFVCTIYAFSVMVELLQRVPVFLFQLTLNLEPVYGIFMAVLILGGKEKMDLNFYVGTAVILAAVLSYPYLKRKLDRPFGK